ncbi:MAG: TauD/TfdA family dioxygenase [Alphaproteobacteria bacterium]|nr:TauD/TfdA family dioxygenase [Alphaproteobacteria bacterium]
MSLFYCHRPAPPDQAQTLYADGVAAYAALPDDLKARVEGLQALHVRPRSGRSPLQLRAGERPKPLPPHEQPQPQPVARTHPVTGQTALFLCEYGQLDWQNGPFVGLEPGPDGEGARLAVQLMHHYTDPRFVYAHEWRQGDLIVYDNRCTIHAATWFDADRYERIMWRTTVRGNPGPDYAGEAPSWIPRPE